MSRRSSKQSRSPFSGSNHSVNVSRRNSVKPINERSGLVGMNSELSLKKKRPFVSGRMMRDQLTQYNTSNFFSKDNTQ